MRSLQEQQIWHIWVSYAAADRDTAEALADDLCAFSGDRGAVWCEEAEQAGEKAVERHIKLSRLEQAAAIFIPVLSHQALEIPAVLDVLSAAYLHWVGKLLARDHRRPSGAVYAARGSGVCAAGVVVTMVWS